MPIRGSEFRSSSLDSRLFEKPLFGSELAPEGEVVLPGIARTSC